MKASRPFMYLFYVPSEEGLIDYGRLYFVFVAIGDGGVAVVEKETSQWISIPS